MSENHSFLSLCFFNAAIKNKNKSSSCLLLKAGVVMRPNQIIGLGNFSLASSAYICWKTQLLCWKWEQSILCIWWQLGVAFAFCTGSLCDCDTWCYGEKDNSLLMSNLQIQAHQDMTNRQWQTSHPASHSTLLAGMILQLFWFYMKRAQEFLLLNWSNLHWGD